jgi:hypothetical protein
MDRIDWTAVLQALSPDRSEIRARIFVDGSDFCGSTSGNSFFLETPAQINEFIEDPVAYSAKTAGISKEELMSAMDQRRHLLDISRKR